MTILNFRNELAAAGIELTPKEARKFYNGFEALKDSVKRAVEEVPNYYMEICNRTTEEKLADIERYSKEYNDTMTLKEYNDLMKMVKLICELEGWNEG